LKLEFGTGSRFGRFSYKSAKKLIDYALENGINRFDTGYAYGKYRSQPLLAKCLKNKIKSEREDIIISTKCPAISGEYINYCVNQSLETFKSGYLDHFHLWGPSIKDIESNKVLKELAILLKEGKIKKASINTHEINIMKKISSGFYSEIKGMMIDYNLLKQNRLEYIKESKKNDISIFAGTVLCQGLLINSIHEIFIRTFSPFYLGRTFVREQSREYIQPSKIMRNYLKKEYSDLYESIPLSFIVNEKLLDSYPIGMLSIGSIKKNLNIVKNPINKKTTDKIASWALQNCQINDF